MILSKASYDISPGPPYQAKKIEVRLMFADGKYWLEVGNHPAGKTWVTKEYADNFIKEHGLVGV